MIVLPNLQGDIVSDLCAGLVGGLGFAPAPTSATTSASSRPCTAPRPTSRARASPTRQSLILSGLMMLRHMGLTREAAIIENALLATLESGIHTGDFGDKTKPSGTAAVRRAIKNRLGPSPRPSPGRARPRRSRTACTSSRPPPAGQQVIRTFKNIVTTSWAATSTSIRPSAPWRRRGDERASPGHALQAHAHQQPRHTGLAHRQRLHRVRRLLPRPLRAADGVIAPATIGQSRCVALMDKIAEKFTVCSYELLRVFDGVKGYSMAQGQ
jgi:isocitrate dehydrogenase